MKILFVTNNYKPYGGGVVSSIESFRYELQRRGHVVKVVTLDFTGMCESEINIIRLECSIRFTYQESPIALPLFVRRQLDEIFQQEKPDIVHVHHPFGLGPVAVKVARSYSIPVVFTHHSQYGEYARHYTPFFRSFAQTIIERKVKLFCKTVDSIVVPSQSIKKLLEAKNLETLLNVVPSGILPLFNCTSCPLKRRSPSFSLLTVSRFVSEKNIPFLLQVMKQLDERFNLTLIGFGRLYDELQSYAYTELGLSRERVIFINNPAKTVIAQFYQQSDLFIFSSTTETQGIVFAESMAAGTPIVAVRAPGSQDCVKEGVNGFLVDTVEEMVQRIHQIQNDPALHYALQKNAWQSAQEFSIEKATERLLTVYESHLS